MTDALSLSFHGAARTTTGSRHLMDYNGQRILFDCGFYQGRRKDTYTRNLTFDFDAASVDRVLLSHAHIDHSGNLPNLVKSGFAGPIHSTPATMDLCRIMLRDSAHIQEKDAKWVSRRNAKRGREEVVEPIYTMEDAERCLDSFVSVPYKRVFDVGQGLTAQFLDAGHILGSASVTVTINHEGKVYRLAFSGDIGRNGLPLLRDPVVPDNLDWLMMEGTYGNRPHANIHDAQEELRATIVRVAARGGKIIMPSFSVERTQEIVYYLNDLYNKGLLPDIPIYVDSPLAVRATDVFRLHPDCFDAETHDILLYDDDVLGFDRLTYTRSVEESKALNRLAIPHMIISASGMCEAGRILHHLRNSIHDTKNCVMFVGYQAEGTLGRRIVERHKEVNIFGEPYPLRAEVVTLNTMSGHADETDLFNYAKSVRDTSPNLKKVFLIHGEEVGLLALAGRLRNELKLDVTVPELNERHGLL